MAAPKPRDITPIMQAIRNFLSQRTLKNHHRFEGKYSPRTVPPANLPHGTSHNLSVNYYYTRDGRRDSKAADLAFTSGYKAIESGEKPEGSKEAAAETAPAPEKPRARRPGQVYNWDV